MDWKEAFKEKILGPYIDINDIDHYLKLKYDNIPKRLFKYREFDTKDSSIKNLVCNTVWMNSPKNFNDPYDCAVTVNPHKIQSPQKGIEALFEAIGISKSKQKELIPIFLEDCDPLTTALRFLVSEEFLDSTLGEELIAEMRIRTDKVIEDFSEMSKNLTKVCAFSESENSVLMWAHYASYHTGFCIEYDFPSLGFESITTKFLYPVFYNEFLHDHTNHVAGIDIKQANPLSIVLPVITKALDWSYEKEWRLVYSNNFMRNPQTHTVPMPTKVYAGAKISAQNLDKLERICLEIEVPLVKMKISNTSFNIIPSNN